MKTCPNCATEVSDITRYCPVCSGRIHNSRASDSPAQASSDALARRATVAAASVQAATQAALSWLTERGVIHEGMSIGERMRACALYRVKIARHGHRKPSTEWASNLLREIEDGREAPRFARELAAQALRGNGHETEEKPNE